MKIFNKGQRTFTIDKDINFLPNSFKDVDDKLGDKLLKAYPREIVKFEDYEDPRKKRIDMKKFNDLEKRVREQDTKLKNLQDENAVLIKENETLKKNTNK